MSVGTTSLDEKSGSCQELEAVRLLRCSLPAQSPQRRAAPSCSTVSGAHLTATDGDNLHRLARSARIGGSRLVGVPGAGASVGPGPVGRESERSGHGAKPGGQEHLDEEVAGKPRQLANLRPPGTALVLASHRLASILGH